MNNLIFYFLGFFTNTINEWAKLSLGERFKKKSNFEKCLHETFMLAQKLNQIPNAYRQLFSMTILFEEGVKLDSIPLKEKALNDEIIDNLRFILEYKLGFKQFGLRFRELKELESLGILILTRKHTKYIVSNPSIDEFIKKNGDDRFKLASEFQKLIINATEGLITDIESYLHQQNLAFTEGSLENKLKSHYKIIKNWLLKLRKRAS